MRDWTISNINFKLSSTSLLSAFALMLMLLHRSKLWLCVDELHCCWIGSFTRLEICFGCLMGGLNHMNDLSRSNYSHKHLFQWNLQLRGSNSSQSSTISSANLNWILQDYVTEHSQANGQGICIHCTVQEWPKMDWDQGCLCCGCRGTAPILLWNSSYVVD